MAERGRPRRFDRTDALDRALMAFWRKGYEATSMGDLVAAMGINSPSLYAAYGSKEALFCEAVQHYCEHYAVGLLSALNDARDAAHGLAAMFDAAITLFTQPRHPYGCFIVMAAAGNAPASPEIQDKLSELRRERSDHIAARIERDVAEGRLRPDLPIGALADLYTAILQGMAVAARDGISPSRLAHLYIPSLSLLDGIPRCRRGDDP
ncbi:TetR/AcrR family transcriptional regulator [Methylobacterium sp. 17Sr1-1]|uniref:TetR/AcrR family transcriptional regulator n=1 Tax=Methylobacterium sp. 17Sr1-1 TaxID=2202826 RepID=UPI000D6F620F|nr:TetR/AcrR family transcriptional regulator [Methylobacterium sp. 17Sr1-1]AWN52876.1 TetR/AcrR family transcriptional regulator [Methylobacterium sp. 17Sr1-1]